MSLSDRYGVKEVNVQLDEYASKLLEENKILELIQLYRMGRRYSQAAILLHRVCIVCVCSVVCVLCVYR